VCWALDARRVVFRRVIATGADTGVVISWAYARVGANTVILVYIWLFVKRTRVAPQVVFADRVDGAWQTLFWRYACEIARECRAFVDGALQVQGAEPVGDDLILLLVVEDRAHVSTLERESV
jgi:hypothetical protein